MSLIKVIITGPFASQSVIQDIGPGALTHHDLAAFAAGFYCDFDNQPTARSIFNSTSDIQVNPEINKAGQVSYTWSGKDQSIVSRVIN